MGSLPGRTQLLQCGPELCEEAVWHHAGRAQAAPEVSAHLLWRKQQAFVWDGGREGGTEGRRPPWHPHISLAPELHGLYIRRRAQSQNASVSCCASPGGSEPQQEGPQVWSHDLVGCNVVPHSLSRGRSTVRWPLQRCGGVGAQVVTCELLMETFLCPEFGLLRTSCYLKTLMPGNSGQTARPSRRSETRVPVAPAG